MRSCIELKQALQAGLCDSSLEKLYAPDGNTAALNGARSRALHVADQLMEIFHPAQSEPAALFSGPGRTEIGGNHTDHQHGHVLCGSVNLDILACASRNSLNVIRAVSEGYPRVEINLDDLQPKKEEFGSSAALIRGVAAGISQRGFSLSGIDIYMVSDVLSGSGLSSSAAFEILIGNVINHFCCDDSLSAVDLACIGQYAENVFFGKPCGLMDQMASSVGGAVAIDFKDPAAPSILAIDVGGGLFRDYSLCIIDTKADHADLTDDYADITNEMKSVAAYFGKEVLRDVPEQEVFSSLPELRKACGDRAVLRAIHFYEDDMRAVKEAEALQHADLREFLNLINDSGRSSAMWLQNIWSVGNPQNQAASVSLAVAQKLLQGEGAVRIHGGGFGGTIQAFVPNHLLNEFREGMDTLLGEGSCHVLRIRPEGGCLVTE